ncbi:MAG TPA: hypothetical protein VI731_09315 [Bacteroidia bacterium]|nr:hypothetical protein [Bacteroidia bacterium]
MTPLGIIILTGLGGYIVFKIIQRANKKNKRKSGLQLIEARWKEDKILQKDFEILKEKLSSLYLFENFKDYETAAANALKNKIRHSELVAKYGSQIAMDIIEGKAWIGMTKDQFIESKGAPHDTDREVMKTKTRENFYYYITIDRKRFNTYTFENEELTRILEK